MTMDRNELLNQVNKIFIDTLDIEDIVIEETTQATDVDEWDSLTHIILVVALEKHFKIRFSSKEIQAWKDVGAMLDSIKEKIK
tara:strand:+ start:395 stop:643 length:249 start_codon:yes stop_codon:yes gene_type:complete